MPPDERSIERLTELRHAVESGGYEIPALELADAMISFHRSWSRVTAEDDEEE